MARRKSRKSAYIQPTHEAASRKQSVSGNRSVGASRRAARNPHVRTPSGRVILEPSWKRQFRRIPWVFSAFFLLNLLLNTLFKSDQRGLAHHSENYKLFNDFAVSLVLALAFVPTAYWMEKSTWKRMQREQVKQRAQLGEPTGPRPKAAPVKPAKLAAKPKD